VKFAVVVLAGVAAGVLWANRDSRGIGEWLRRLSDVPTNAVLLMTSGFERDGRDPAKAD
jgi:hypothetical protein